MLPRKAKHSTSSSALPSSFMGLCWQRSPSVPCSCPVDVQTYLSFFQFSVTVHLHLLLVVLEEV
jgi:hypothetical protein